MPSGEWGLGIFTSICTPFGCRFTASCRYPPIVVISGNNTLMARATRIVWICSLSSGATPGGNSKGIGVAAGAFAPNLSTSAGIPTYGRAAGGADLTGGVGCGLAGGGQG